MDLLDLTMLENQLANNRVRIDFIKVDGTSRTMLCTKDPTIITESHLPSGNQDKLMNNAAVLKVFDLEKQGWRSMRISNIKSWQLDV